MILIGKYGIIKVHSVSISGRADEEIEYYHQIRESIVPDIILQLL